ncbi:MAG TPA: F0F1 ATP synthase subunit A, partial [Planctomycetota bacterium]|nr:F0F1 ATP synthase subunit A [Planctomycetota bacterium]
MHSARFLIIAGLLACLAAPAVRAQHGEQEPGHAPAPGTMQMSNADIFNHQFSHSVPYAIFEPGIGPRYDGNGIVVDGREQKVSLLTVYNVQPWQWICLGLMFAVFLPVLGSFRSGRANRLTRVMRGFCHWVRDEMVYSVMGKEEGRAFVPLFMFTFFFITFQNTIGLLPSAGHHFPLAIYTATGTPFVTVSLAIVTLS